MNFIVNLRAIALTITVGFLIAAGLTASANAQNSTTKTQAVRVTNTVDEPVPVKVIKDVSSRKRIQITVGTDILAGGSGRSILFPVPAGKRLVIEHVSAHTYRPAGIRMNITFDTYFKNDAVFDENQVSATHGVVLVEQGTELSGNEVSTGSHNVLAFAEERLGTVNNLPLRVRFALSGTVPFGKFARGVVVFTGYMEDHPAEQ